VHGNTYAYSFLLIDFYGRKDMFMWQPSRVPEVTEDDSMHYSL
jgi:hypothetical protein